MVDSCTLNDCNNYLLYGLGGGFLLSICANVIWSSYKNYSIRKQYSNYLQALEGGWDELSNSPKSGDDISI